MNTTRLSVDDTVLFFRKEHDLNLHFARITGVHDKPRLPGEDDYFYEVDCPGFAAVIGFADRDELFAIDELPLAYAAQYQATLEHMESELGCKQQLVAELNSDIQQIVERMKALQADNDMGALLRTTENRVRMCSCGSDEVEIGHRGARFIRCCKCKDEIHGDARNAVAKVNLDWNLRHQAMPWCTAKDV